MPLLATLGAVVATKIVLSALLPAKKWSSRNKNVMITGASSGIGASLARFYAAEGAHLWLVARRADKLEEVSEECRKLGARTVTLVVADVATEDGWKTIRESLAKAGSTEVAVDLLVLNAGLAMGSTFARLSATSSAVPIMKRLMDVNYLGAIGVYDAVLPHLMRSSTGVRLIVVSSVVGLVAPPTRTGYAASKFALKGRLVGSLAQIRTREHARNARFVRDAVL